MKNEQRWMLDTIAILVRAGDHRGAFVMCLIAIDSLAWSHDPSNKSNGKRFQRFLHAERQPFWGGNFFLPDAGTCKQNAKIDVPKLGNVDEIDKYIEDMDRWAEEIRKDAVPIEYVLWKYCRCPMVHEGSQLSIDGERVVTLDWSIPSTQLSIKVDQDAVNVIVIGGQFLLRVLCLIVEKHLAPGEGQDHNPSVSQNEMG